jgi:hypothetical protein
VRVQQGVASPQEAREGPSHELTPSSGAELASSA